MNFKKLLPFIGLLLFAVSCDKSDSFSDSNLVAESTTNQQDDNSPKDGQITSRGSLATYSQNPNIAPFREMFGNHFRYHATVEPWHLLPEYMRETYKTKYLEEKAVFDALGYNAWVDQKVLSGRFTSALGVSLKNLKGTVDGINGTNLGTLVQTLEGQRNNISLMTEEQATLQLIYDIILNVINELYPDGGVEERGDPCKIKDLIDDILKGAGIGAAVGEAVSEIFANMNPQKPTEVIIQVLGQAVAVSLTIIGGIIGGLIGGVVGIFNGDECDCGPIQGITVINPTSACSSTSGFQLYGWGAGDDAEFYDWVINEGNSSASFPGQPALLGPFVTQVSPNVPLNVVVTTLCAEAMGDPGAMAANTETKTINLFSLPSTQVGTLTVYANAVPQNGQISANVNTDSNFQLSTTTNGPNITYSVTIFPPNIATLTQNGNSIDVDWLSAGTGGITFSAVNSCSGQSTYLQLPFTVAP